MEIKLTSKTAPDWTGDGLAIATFGQETVAAALNQQLLNLDQTTLLGTLQEIVTEAEYKGDSGSMVSGRVGGSAAIRKVMLVGLGDPAQGTIDNWRKAAAQAVKWANGAKCKTLALSFPLYNLDQELTAQAIAEGALLAAHQDNRFKSQDIDDETPKNGDSLELVEILGLDSDAAQAGLTRAKQIADGVILTRELVSAPANVITPEALAETALAIASDYSDCMTVEVLEREQCEAMGMGAYLGVSQASELPPKFIHLTYSGKSSGDEAAKRKLAIVGKGVTFDSGGLNIKAGANSGIAMMKTDMGGAGATLGAAKAIAQIKPQDIEIHFIVAACENMISGRAIHPGDILTASNGKTIEVNNTDAEGRLTLADALVFADKLELDGIVDLATLTGACVVALGDEIAGMWSNDDDLAGTIHAAAKLAGEKFWRMPLEEPYFEAMKSVVADFKNTGNRAGGAITAALFLKKFVANTPAWAHLDIAGPVWTDKDSGAYTNPGGTGYPVRTLVNLALSF
ncbi:cytosol aminopeptidase [Thalassoporum mexicanum PCC 7367]|uniref:leucyl aminopeptidase n=1 Tax=Thalassoporum mexicanum TaxID=3457544 RepID=UPI00029F8F2D|nr:leucyl aminopeptidase [Pseudanabaena sp. PCC 7367]AFY70758.1 cytosol aminopeptidase [Pseudanabaena sp. PCC 7367]